MAAQRYNSLPVYSLKLVKEKNLKYPLFQVNASDVAVQVFQSYLQDCATENIAILLLDAQNHFLGIVTVAMGGISNMRVSPRDILAPALAGRANSFIIGHNHPSGNITPSPEDIHFTEVLKSAAQMMGCPMLDHIIVSSGLNKDSYSFADSGLL